jgi:hypothetical protein
MPETDSTGITIQINLPGGIERLIPKIVDFIENFDGNFPQNPGCAVPGEVMNVDDVCREFKLNKTKLYALTMKTGPGSIPRFKIGRDLRFKRSELIKWFDTQRV